MATSTPTIDPFDAAMNPSEPNQDRTYFGEIIVVDPWFCVLEKGVGKRPFDPSRDDIGQRSTAIKLSVEVSKRDGGSYTLDQDTLDWSKEWKDFTLPSLRQLGIDLRTLKGRWVQVKRQATGDTYKKKDTNEIKDKTALVFMAVYPDQETMKAAADTFYLPRNGDSSTPAPAAPAVAATPAPQPTTENFAERQFAEQVLGSLWKATGEDSAKFLEAIAKNPMLNKYFTPESPEVTNYTLPL